MQKIHAWKFTNAVFFDIIDSRMNKKTYFKSAWAVLIVALAAVLPIGAESSQSVSVIDLEKTGLMYFNADPSLGIEDVQKAEIQDRFAPIDGRSVWVGKRAPVAWIQFSLPERASAEAEGSPDRVQDTAALPVRWLLRVRPSFSIILDSVELYIPRKDGGFSRYVTGALNPESALELDSRYFLFSLPEDAYGRDCYLRFSSNTDVLINLELLSPKAMTAKELTTFVVYGLIFGILFAMAAYSVFMLVSLKDRSYLFYILFTISIGLWLFYVQGFSKALFGKVPFVDQAMLWLWAGMFITWGTVFSISFLKLKRGSFLLSVMLVLAALGAVVSAAGLLGWNQIAFTLSHYLGLVAPVVIIFAAAVRLSRGFRPALSFLIAWLFLALGGLVFSLMGLQILPVNFFTINALSIGAALESIMLGMALADRFGQLESEKTELEKAQKKYRELSYTDALTGFYNKLFLANYFENELAGHQQDSKDLAGILMDVDDLKAINDSFGHFAGDSMLLALAESVRTCVRGNDLVCRLNSDELVILLPATTKENAFRVAERIRIRFETDSLNVVNDKAIHCTVSIGVIQLQSGEDMGSFLARADKAMYEAKHRGKNCAVMM